MNLFLDCKWTDVLASELVSIALVSSDDRQVFYTERDPLLVDPMPWVKMVVYPLLDRGQAALSDAAMTHALRTYLATVDSPRICYDTGHDRDLCQYVIDGFDLPESSGPVPVLQWQRLDDAGSALERWWAAHPEEKPRRHHALMDAKALRGAYWSLWGSDDIGAI